MNASLFTMIRNLAIVSMFLYCAGSIVAAAIPEECYGLECEEILCPKGYAIQVSETEYLPCKAYDDYRMTEDERILVK